MTSTTHTESLLLELGRAVYVFQAIEARIKLLLPHLAVPGTGEPPVDEGWSGRQKYLESKEMLGNLVRLLQERISTEDPTLLEQEWRAVVHARNDVIHNFALQPFARCATSEEQLKSIEYVRTRRARAVPMLRMLEILMHGFITTLQLPSDFEGEVPISLPEWLGENAA